MRLRKRITSEMVGERLLACGVKRECAELERAFGGGFEDVEPPVLVSEMRSEARHDVADTALVAITSLRVTIVEVRVTVGSERTSRTGLNGRPCPAIGDIVEVTRYFGSSPMPGFARLNTINLAKSRVALSVLPG